MADWNIQLPRKNANSAVKKGFKRLQEMIDKFDPQHFSTLLQALGQAVNEEIVPRYPHLNLDKPYK